MTQVHRSADCGNSPKNGIAEDIAVALETKDIELLTIVLDSGVVWHHAGGVVTTALLVVDQVATANSPSAVTIDHVISHGKVAAVNGTTKRGKHEGRFCHVLEFTSVKFHRVRRIESFHD